MTHCRIGGLSLPIVGRMVEERNGMNRRASQLGRVGL